MITCKRPKCTAKSYTRGYCRKHAKITQKPQPTHQQIAATIERLHWLGYTDREMCNAAQIHKDTVYKFRAGKTRTIRAETFAKLDAITTPNRTRTVPTWPYTRRIKALMAIGIQAKEIAAACDTYPRRIREILYEEYPTIARDMADRIHTYYQTASHTPYKKPVRLIQARNYAPPAAWNDIDDPDEQPAGAITVDMPKRRIKNTTFQQARMKALIAHYGSINETARQLNMTPRTVSVIANGEQATIRTACAERMYKHHKQISQISQKETAA